MSTPNRGRVHAKVLRQEGAWWVVERGLEQGFVGPIQDLSSSCEEQ